MSAKPKVKDMSQTGFGPTRIDRDYFDIIECALTNNFDGVNEALAKDPSQINAQRIGSGITPIMAASGRGLTRMVEHLLSQDGIDIALIDDFGRNVFDHGRPFPEIITLLVQHSHPQLSWKEPGLFPI